MKFNGIRRSQFTLLLNGILFQDSALCCYFIFYSHFRYLTAEIVPGDSTTQPLNVKKYDLLASVLDVTEQIHGEFGAAAIRNGLESKNT
jgi:hypothetical protein